MIQLILSKISQMTLRPNEARAKLSIIFLFICLGFLLGSLVFGIMQLNFFLAVVDGENRPISEFMFIKDMGEYASFATSLIYITSTVFFIRWFRRAYFNLHSRFNNLKYSEGMAAGAWFIPIFNFFGPYQIFKEIIVKTEEAIKNSDSTFNSPVKLIHLNVYWTFFILPIGLNVRGLRVAARRDIDSLIEASYYNIASIIVSVLACLMLMYIVKKYSQIEPLLEETKSEIDKIGDLGTDN